jgi:hypothetical protein
MVKKLKLFYKLVLAAVVIAAVIVQLMHGLQSPTFSIANFFSFFTIESNIIGAIILLLSTAVSGRKLDYWRGAATFYMTITGVIYVVLLSGADVQTPLPWVNAVLHYIFPVALLIDWVIDRPRQKLLLRKSLLWLLLPMAYAAYSLVRGHFVHWYPYPFINVDKLGYASILLNCLIIAPGLLVLALIIVYIPRPHRAKLC